MKISYNDATYILNYKKNHFFKKHFCNWKLDKRSDTAYSIKCFMKWWIYVLIFIPAHLIDLFVALYDGGLKEFEIESRESSINIYSYTYFTFNRANEVWCKNKE